MVIIFIASVLLECLLHIVSGSRRAVRLLVPLVMLVVVVVGALPLLRWPNIVSVLFALIGAYRLFNAARIWSGRMNPQYLHHATWRSSVWLMGSQGFLFGLWWLWQTAAMSHESAWLWLAALQLLVALVLLFSVLRRMDRTRYRESTQHFSDVQLPAVTVAIPARNETDDLEACLESVLESDYPKLEVLVLDDCSQNKRTPEIIRQFAQAGVRFLQGEEPRESWLAKNQAYQQMLQEATGEVIVFCGVDVRFSRHSLRNMMTLMLAKKKAMVSVLPRRRDDAVLRMSLVQAMRYWWELAPPRRLFNRPAVLSSCWAINRDSLIKLGGFAQATRAIVPEAILARAMTIGDRYSFVRSDTALGIESVKNDDQQVKTAVRMRYPQLHRRPEQVLLVSIAEIALLVLPLPLWVLSFITAIPADAGWTAFVAAVLLSVAYGIVTVSTRVGYGSFSWLGLPAGTLLDSVLLHVSMWQYEFATVTWKGRNVCLPVMRTTMSPPPQMATRHQGRG